MPTNEPIQLAVIGGSGVYDMEALTDVEQRQVTTPFGEPSDAVTVGTLAGRRVAFLPRHGRGHRLTPTEVNARANIWALKSLDVERIVSVTACGSLREEIAPRHVVIPDQIFDHTRARGPYTFFGDGLVVHIGFDEPYCPHLSDLLYQAVQASGGTAHRGGTFITIEGPRFSTKAESQIYQQWGCDVIGMTAVPEAQLAREAEICYAAMAHVTDYDVWHETEEAVNVEMLIANLRANTALAKRVIEYLAANLLDEPSCACGSALATAILTQREAIGDETKERYRLLLGKYL
ncbi:MAG: S-methyl-5'-thioadenosine phosphorylase [Anaerolineae bacterium]|nr:MAG: S-methyl-5'-thioadenosine phosphorylase [Anaerolineae bacterium]